MMNIIKSYCEELHNLVIQLIPVDKVYQLNLIKKISIVMKRMNHRI
jgi:hypothetical protein